MTILEECISNIKQAFVVEPMAYELEQNILKQVICCCKEKRTFFYFYIPDKYMVTDSYSFKYSPCTMYANLFKKMKYMGFDISDIGYGKDEYFATISFFNIIENLRSK